MHTISGNRAERHDMYVDDAFTTHTKHPRGCRQVGHFQILEAEVMRLHSRAEGGQGGLNHGLTRRRSAQKVPILELVTPQDACVEKRGPVTWSPPIVRTSTCFEEVYGRPKTWPNEGVHRNDDARQRTIPRHARLSTIRDCCGAMMLRKLIDDMIQTSSAD